MKQDEKIIQPIKARLFYYRLTIKRQDLEIKKPKARTVVNQA